MEKNKNILRIKSLWIKTRSFIVATLISLLYVLVDNNLTLTTDNLFSVSITSLSILFGFNMVVVTHYYSNSEFNKFLKKIEKFNIFKNKYRRTIILLIESLIVIYILSLFESIDCCVCNISYSAIGNYITIFLSLLNLMKAFDCVSEFFNVYGSTYSNTMQNINEND